MQFIYPSVRVRSVRFDSRAAMEESLRKSGDRYCWIDTGDGHGINFRTLVFAENPVDGSLKPPTWRIALCSGETGIDPQVLPVPAFRTIFLASDAQVIVVEFGADAPLLQQSFESPVYSISYLDELQSILVSYETGVARLTAPTGRRLWDTRMNDVVSGVTVRDKRTAELSLMEGGHYSVDLSNGRLF